VRERFLRALGREDFGLGVERDAESFLVPRRDGPSELGVAAVEGVLVRRRVGDRRLGRLNDELGRGRVGIADAEMDDRPSGGHGGLLLAVNLGKQVRRKRPEAVALGLHGAGCPFHINGQNQPMAVFRFKLKATSKTV